VGSHSELGHRRPSGHEPNQHVSWPSTDVDADVFLTAEFPALSLADLTDLAIFLQGLDPTLFPGVPSSIQVHQGFALEHAK